jgi:cytochrome c-type biogenesis protein CcmH
MAGVSSEHDFTKMIQRVEEKTRNNPDDGEAWSMLAKTYAAVGQWPGALQAFEKAMKLLPGDASVLSGYAEALAIANNRVLAGKPVELVQKALEIDPEDIKGLELAGIHAFQTQRFEQASVYLKRLYNLLPPNDPYAQDILATQKEAERLAFPGLAGMGSPDISPAVTESRSSPVQGGRVAGRVDIAPALKSRLDGSATVFLFARPGAGGAPVAAVRSTVDSLPLEFSLDDSMAMNPVNVLSQHMEVALVARVSMSGNPMSQPGDFEGSVSGVKVGTTGVKLLIDRVLP